MNSNGKITAPISLHADVYPVLGLSKSGTYYDLGYACANSHGKINPWAKYKPVKYEGVDTTGKEWWKSRDGNCGMTIKRLSSYREAVDFADGSMNGWSYSAPNGGSNPYRLTDFVGYNHNAVPPISNFKCPSTISNQFQNTTFLCSAMIMSQSQDDNLSLGDFELIADCYFGVYVKQSSSSQARRVTSSTPIKNGGSTVSVKSYGLTTGKWDVYPFLCTAILEQDSTDVTNTCYSIPMLSKASINIVSSYISISVIAGSLPSVGLTTNITIRITNNSSDTINFRNNSWMCRFSNKDFDDALVMGETRGTIEDFSVSSGTTRKIVEVRLTSTLINDGNAKVFVSLNSANYIGQGHFLTPIG